MMKNNLGDKVPSQKMGDNSLSASLESLENPTMGVYEIANNTTIEAVVPVFFDSNALREPNYRLCQLNSRGMRYYYKMGEKGVEFYPSVTTILKKCAPENVTLTNWRLSLGKDEADAYTMERANFGSLCHGLLQELMITRKFDLDSVRPKMLKYMERENLPYSFLDNENEMKYAILSFAKWMKDYDVRPLAVEISLYHPIYKFAGMVDLVCDMRKYPVGDKRGDERIRAICDYKTTNKGFHDEHILQLGMYKIMWDCTFPDTPIDALANIAPKAWWNTAKKQISYNFEWQTDKEELLRLPHILALYGLLPEENKKVILCNGVVDLNEDIDKLAAVVTLEELVEQKQGVLEEGKEGTSTTESSLF